MMKREFIRFHGDGTNLAPSCLCFFIEGQTEKLPEGSDAVYNSISVTWKWLTMTSEISMRKAEWLL